VPLIYITNSKI